RAGQRSAPRAAAHRLHRALQHVGAAGGLGELVLRRGRPADRRADHRQALRRRRRAAPGAARRTVAAGATRLAGMTAALLFAGERVEPGELERRVACGAKALEDAGVREDDVVALMLHNGPAYVEAMLACRMLGAYYCPINWHYKADEAGFILRDSGARVLVIDAGLRPQIAEGIPSGLATLSNWKDLREASRPWKGAPRMPRGNVPYTSGTTGRPKGVLRQVATEEQRALAAALYRDALGIAPGMRALVPAPLYHSAPNSYAVQVALAGELLAIEPRFDALRTLELIESLRLTHAYLVPTMYVRMLRLAPEARKRHDLSSLRFVASTGSPCAPDVKRAMIEWLGPVIHETYAASELGYITAIGSQEGLDRPGTVGRALGGCVVKILD